MEKMNIERHIDSLINETLDEVALYLHSQHEKNIYRENEYGQPRSYIAKLLWWNPYKKISKRLYNLFHLKAVMEEAYKFSYDVYRKKEYVKCFLGKDNKISDLEQVYLLMQDNDSRTIFDYIIKSRVAYIVLGEEAIVLYPLKMIENLKGSTKDGTLGTKIGKNRYKIKGYLIETTFDLLTGTWIEGQYHYTDICIPNNGDVVISCGAFMGETTIWFADKVGRNGKVYSFEPTEYTYNVAIRNVINNSLQDVVTMVQCGVWDEDTDLEINVSKGLEEKSCNSITGGGVGEKIKAIKIDTYVKRNNINKVDFIKMDIEGAEMKALIGASNTIKRYKPQLAICVYHKSDDLIEIPIFISGLVPEYKFYLSQKNAYETIIFAKI